MGPSIVPRLRHNFHPNNSLIEADGYGYPALQDGPFLLRFRWPCPRDIYSSKNLLLLPYDRVQRIARCKIFFFQRSKAH